MAAIPQARIHGKDDLRLDHIDPPACGEDDVLVQVRECGICGSDLGYLAMGGLTAPGVPMPLGHELWGVVSAAGANVSHVAPGDAVVVQPLSGDRHIGNGGSEGGFTSLLRVRNVAQDPAGVMKLPAGFRTEWGALVEPLAVAQHSANRVQAAPTDRAVVFGAGPIGLCIFHLLRCRGLEQVAVVDLSARRLQAAAELGAIALRGDDPQLSARLIEIHGTASFFGLPMPGSTLYFEATGARAVFEHLLQLAGPLSRICLTGVHKEPATVDLVTLLAKEIAIIPAMGYRDEFAEVIELLQTGRLDPSSLVTHRFALSELNAAFALARDQGHD